MPKWHAAGNNIGRAQHTSQLPPDTMLRAPGADVAASAAEMVRTPPLMPRTLQLPPLVRRTTTKLGGPAGGGPTNGGQQRPYARVLLSQWQADEATALPPSLFAWEDAFASSSDDEEEVPEWTHA